jgi:integrase
LPDYGRGGRSSFSHGDIVPTEPTPARPVWPRGDLGRATADAIIDVAATVWPQNMDNRRRLLRGLLERMATMPGDTWQQRWEAASTNETYFAGESSEDGIGYKMLLSLRVIRMDLYTLRMLTAQNYAELFRVAQADPALDAYFDHVNTMTARREYQLAALFDIACALTIYGIRFAELTPAAMLHYAWECRRLGVGVRKRSVPGRFAGHVAWVALVESGHFPSGTPMTLAAAAKPGQLSITQLIDQYDVTNQQVRQLLIDYLQRRAAELDYTTVVDVVRHLVSYFWVRIEKLNPGQSDLNIPSHVYDQWRAAINLRDDGRARIGVDPILMGVRSFYFDLHTWAATEPHRWAHWVAPCPIAPGDFAGSARRARRVQERSAARTRARQPLLTDLVTHVTDRYEHARDVHTAAKATKPGTALTAAGRTYTRIWTDQDRSYLKLNHLERIRVQDSTGQIVNAERAEDEAFWDWAIVEVLRLTGVRIEEMLELTQLSVRRYVRPNGETIGLLVIAPSKSDRERVIPMAPELFAVIAAIIRRHTPDGGMVPPVSRYDPAERVHSAPLPYLFQRVYGSRREVFGPSLVVDRLRMRCDHLAKSRPDFAGAPFTPHDFRRLFATDLVNNGLPIHIGAALLGHLNLETTRGYVAVFEEDVARHYQAFLQRRRDRRPAEEYRPTTPDEWTEFEQHFDKRKVELGNCGRPYQTPCVHEHACLRCPMLLVNPAMLPRLDVIEDDLHARRKQADHEGWLGEIESIDLTLSHLAIKRQQAQRLAQRSEPVLLGLPAAPPSIAT